MLVSESRLLLDSTDVVRILRGSLRDPALPPPRTDHATRCVIVSDCRLRANRPTLFVHPEELVYGCGLHLDERGTPGCGPERSNATWVTYAHEIDRREDGLAVYHGLAHALLAASRLDHTEQDAWLVTSELVLARELVPYLAGDGASARVQRWAPGWFLDAAVAAVASDARRPSAPPGPLPRRLRVA